MADDKGGGGGPSFGTLEIVLGILLLAGLIDHFLGRAPLGSDLPTSAREEEVSSLDDTEPCGLSIVRPRRSERVGNMVTVSGTAGDCDWPVTERVAVNAQVIDSKGKPVSAYTSVPPRRVYEGGAAFEGTIVLTKTPAKGTGYVIFLPAVASGSGRSISARIPVTF